MAAILKSIVSRAFPAVILAAAALSLASCHRLSGEAKQIVGSYYIPEIDEHTPLMELRRDGKCTIRNIRPGVVSISVPGRWNVEHDSLVARLDTAAIIIEGDTSLVGNVPARMSRKIIDHTGLSLTLEGPGGVPYVYQRRNI